jgi:hypothetical protein
MHTAFRTRLVATDGAILGFGEATTSSAPIHDGVFAVVGPSANAS